MAAQIEFIKVELKHLPEPAWWKSSYTIQYDVRVVETASARGRRGLVNRQLERLKSFKLEEGERLMEFEVVDSQEEEVQTGPWLQKTVRDRK